MDILPLAPPHRPHLAALLDRVETFTPEERACALELLDSALQRSERPDGPPADYLVLVAAREGVPLGFVCYGPTPMTDRTFDLYWIAADPAARRQGVGVALVRAMEADLARRGGRLVRIETSATEAYGPTRHFYAALDYREEARFRDFYREGDDLVVLAKRLAAKPLPVRDGAGSAAAP